MSSAMTASAPCRVALVPMAVVALLAVYLGLYLREMRAKAQQSARRLVSDGSSWTAPLLPSQSSGRPARFAALDAFRGSTICLMIFVNYGGAGFDVFQHSAWDGFTVADTVFPWFAWIMGFSLYLTTQRTSSRRRSLASILARAVRLFLLGLFLNNGATWSTWRVPGVLQGLSFAYAYVAVVSSAVNPTGQISAKSAISHALLGIGPLLAVSLGMTYWLPVPGCPTGYVGPGGDSDGGMHRNCTGGAHLYVDRMIFGQHHIYQKPTCQPVFHTGAFDPEGVLNWLMMAGTTYAGYLSALLFAKFPAGSRQRNALSSCGFALVLASSLLSTVIPINKNLWSLSFVLLAGGLACIALVIHDISLDWFAWSGFPLTQVGHNPIFIYALHELLQPYMPFSMKHVNATPVCALHLVLALHNITALLCCISVAVWMHQRRVFISI